MIPNTELNLDWLERHGTGGRVANRKIRSVKSNIQRLWDFADINPDSKPAVNCNQVANNWNERLNEVLSETD